MSYEAQFAALSNPIRQQILTELQLNPATVRELTDKIQVSQPVVSQHLRVLRDAGLVDATPSGVMRIYHIKEARLRELRDFLEDHWKASLSTLGKEQPPDA
jgi:DNA-binding transcriptional ArsR family regulator